MTSHRGTSAMCSQAMALSYAVYRKRSHPLTFSQT